MLSAYMDKRIRGINDSSRVRELADGSQLLPVVPTACHVTCLPLSTDTVSLLSVLTGEP